MFLSGGLAEEVDEKVLHAAFIPFGDITDIQIPLDYETGKIRSFATLWASKYESVLMCLMFLFSEKHRGFAFIEFELGEVCTGCSNDVKLVHMKCCNILILTQ